MTDPKVSVVMGVYNGDRYLAESVESILRQEGVSLEFVIVDDGSTDSSPATLSEYAKNDSRLRVIRQGHAGLTAALIRGCADARGEFIARQDADDVSLPGRLNLQAEYLAEHPFSTLLGCWTRYIGPKGEELLLAKRDETPEEATRLLRSSAIKNLQGIGGHGSAMFRRQDYHRAGGYRREFYFAQDIDLWLRLTEFGQVAFVRNVIYAWRMTPASITSRFRQAQVASARIALDLARARARGEAEASLLREAEGIRPEPVNGRGPRADRSAGLYFIGKCLLDRRDTRCVPYLRQAVRQRPFHLRAWGALALALLQRGRWASPVPGRIAD